VQGRGEGSCLLSFLTTLRRLLICWPAVSHPTCPKLSQLPPPAVSSNPVLIQCQIVIHQISNFRVPIEKNFLLLYSPHLHHQTVHQICLQILPCFPRRRAIWSPCTSLCTYFFFVCGRYCDSLRRTLSIFVSCVLCKLNPIDW
jgi:hypothetical protein